MALTDAQLAALMRDPEFNGRVKVCSIRYADSINIQPVPASSHTSLLRYAAETIQSPDTMTLRLVPVVVLDSAVQESGTNITDEALQGATEASVNKLYS